MLMNLNAQREIRTVNMGAKIVETYLPGFFIGLQKKHSSGRFVLHADFQKQCFPSGGKAKYV